MGGNKCNFVLVEIGLLLYKRVANRAVQNLYRMVIDLTLIVLWKYSVSYEGVEGPQNFFSLNSSEFS